MNIGRIRSYWICSAESCLALKTLLSELGFIRAASIGGADLVIVRDANDIGRIVVVDETKHYYVIVAKEFERDDFRALYGDRVLVTSESTKELDLRQFIGGLSRRRSEQKIVRRTEVPGK